MTSAPKSAEAIAQEIWDNWSGPETFSYERENLLKLIAAAITNERASLRQAVEAAWPSFIQFKIQVLGIPTKTVLSEYGEGYDDGAKAALTWLRERIEQGKS